VSLFNGISLLSARPPGKVEEGAGELGITIILGFK